MGEGGDDSIIQRRRSRARIVSGHDGQWVYRGQRKDSPLQPSLEKYIRAWDSDIALSPKIERQMIRDFRRRYPDHADSFFFDRQTILGANLA
jgi:hypothetical protein